MSSLPGDIHDTGQADGPGWQLAQLREFTPRGKNNAIVDGPFGSNLKTEHYRTSGVPIVTSGYVTTGRFRADSYLYVDQEKFDQERRSAVAPGDIVMAKIGARCGASAVLPRDHPVGILSGNALKISVDESRHSTDFVACVLRWMYERGDLDVLRSIGAQPAISMPLLKQLAIPCPPLADQRRIAAVLADADGAIGALERCVAKKQSVKQGMMQELLTGRTRLPGFEQGWTEVTIGSLARVTGGGTPSTRVTAYWNGGIPWFTPAEIRASGSGLVSCSQRTITSEGLANSGATLLPAGTVLVTSRASIGNCAVAEVPVATNQGFASMVPKDSRSTWFLYYWTQQNTAELEHRAAGSTFLEISPSKVASIPLRQPALDEQKAIGDVLCDADMELDALAVRLVKARAIKNGILQQLLTGRTRLLVEEGAA